MSNKQVPSFLPTQLFFLGHKTHFVKVRHIYCIYLCLYFYPCVDSFELNDIILFAQTTHPPVEHTAQQNTPPLGNKAALKDSIILNCVLPCINIF